MHELNCQRCQTPIARVNKDATITLYSHTATCSGVIDAKELIEQLFRHEASLMIIRDEIDKKGCLLR